MVVKSVVDLRDRPDLRFHRAHDLRAALERGAGRRLRHHLELAHVVVDHEVQPGVLLEQIEAADEDAARSTSEARRRGGGGTSRGAALVAQLEPVVEPAGLGRPAPADLARARRPALCERIRAASIGREGEGDEQRDHDGEGGGEAEGVPELADEPAHERHGQEDHHERERGRRHGERDLLGALDGRLERGPPLLLRVPEDVLEHDDRVVDDDARSRATARAWSGCSG